MNLKKLLVIPLCGLMLAATSCGDYVGKEKSHPFFVKAETCRASGGYNEAAQYYEEFLNVCPRSPVAHYELASLYADHLNDPYRAIYHYQRYLELDRNSPDAENIRKFIDGSKRKIFEQLSTQFESADTVRAYAEAAKTKKALDQYVAYTKKIQAQNKQLREQNEEMRKRIETFKLRVETYTRESEQFKLKVEELQKKAREAERRIQAQEKREAELEKPEKTEVKNPEPEKTNPVPAQETKTEPSTPLDEQPVPPGAATSTDPVKDKPDSWESADVSAQSPNAVAGRSGEAANPVPPKAQVIRHTVKSGDTLFKIAIKYYGRSSAVRILREANRETLKGRDFLRVGQVLIIPPDPSKEKKP